MVQSFYYNEPAGGFSANHLSQFQGINPRESILGSRRSSCDSSNHYNYLASNGNLILVADDKQIILDAIRLNLDFEGLLPISEFYTNG